MPRHNATGCARHNGPGIITGRGGGVGFGTVYTWCDIASHHRWRSGQIGLHGNRERWRWAVRGKHAALNQIDGSRKRGPLHRSRVAGSRCWCGRGKGPLQKVIAIDGCRGIGIRCVRTSQQWAINGGWRWWRSNHRDVFGVGLVAVQHAVVGGHQRIHARCRPRCRVVRTGYARIGRNLCAAGVKNGPVISVGW